MCFSNDKVSYLKTEQSTVTSSKTETPTDFDNDQQSKMEINIAVIGIILWSVRLSLSV